MKVREILLLFLLYELAMNLRHSSTFKDRQKKRRERKKERRRIGIGGLIDPGEQERLPVLMLLSKGRRKKFLSFLSTFSLSLSSSRYFFS